MSLLLNFTLPDPLFPDSDLSTLPMQNIDPELFQLADIELDSWNSQFTAFSNLAYTNQWNSHEDVFTPSHSPAEGSDLLSPNSSQQYSLNNFSVPVIRQGQEGSVMQRRDGIIAPPGQQSQDLIYPDSFGFDFNIDQWVHSSPEGEEHNYRRTAQTSHTVVEPTTRHLSLDEFRTRPDRHDHDYILYPESPQFDLELDRHDAIRDIASVQWPPRPGWESNSSHMRSDTAQEQNSTDSLLQGVTLPDSSYFEQSPGLTLSRQSSHSVESLVSLIARGQEDERFINTSENVAGIAQQAARITSVASLAREGPGLRQVLTENIDAQPGWVDQTMTVSR